MERSGCSVCHGEVKFARVRAKSKNHNRPYLTCGMKPRCSKDSFHYITEEEALKYESEPPLLPVVDLTENPAISIIIDRERPSEAERVLIEARVHTWGFQAAEPNPYVSELDTVEDVDPTPLIEKTYELIKYQQALLDKVYISIHYFNNDCRGKQQWRRFIDSLNLLPKNQLLSEKQQECLEKAAVDTKVSLPTVVPPRVVPLLTKWR